MSAEEPEIPEMPDAVRDLLNKLRQSASIKAGAILFGQAQIAYFDTLKQGNMSEEQAYALLAHSTEVIIRSMFASIAPIGEVLLKAAQVYEALRADEPTKEVPS